MYQLFSMFCSALLGSLETKAGLIRHLQFTGNFHIRISFRARNVLASRIIKTKQTLGAMFLDVLCPFLGQHEKKVSCLDWPHYFFSYFLFSFLATNWDTLALHTITQCSVTGLHFCFLVPNKINDNFLLQFSFNFYVVINITINSISVLSWVGGTRIGSK